MTKDEIKKAIEKTEQSKAETKATLLEIGFSEEKAEEIAAIGAYTYLKAYLEAYLVF